jgi:hypothetical protein
MFEVIDDDGNCAHCRTDQLAKHIVPTYDVTELLEQKCIQDLMSLAMPSPVLDLDINEYKKMIEKINFGSGIKWGYFDDKDGVPFLPWNLTFKTKGEKLREVFIKPLI